MDGQIEACHGRGHIFLHFRCEIARSVRWSWVGGERSLEDGADPTSPSLTAPHFLFRLLCFPVICSQPPPAAPAPAPARPRFFVFRKVFVPRSGVASSRRTEQGNRWGERRTSFRRSAGERLFRDRRSDGASDRGKLAGLTAASLIFSTKVLSPLCQEWSAFKPCMKAGGRETLPTHRQVRQLDSAPRSVLYGQV